MYGMQWVDCAERCKGVAPIVVGKGVCAPLVIPAAESVWLEVSGLHTPLVVAGMVVM